MAEMNEADIKLKATKNICAYKFQEDYEILQESLLRHIFAYFQLYPGTGVRASMREVVSGKYGGDYQFDQAPAIFQSLQKQQQHCVKSPVGVARAIQAALPENELIVEVFFFSIIPKSHQK